MKKFTFIVSLLTMLCCTATAQLDNNFRLGGQISPSYTWLGINDKVASSDGGRLGMKLGMTGDFYFAENYSLSTGIGFSFANGGTIKQSKGGQFWRKSDLEKEEYHHVAAGGKFDYKLQYVEIPFSLKMRTSEFGYIRYFGEIPIITLGIVTQARGAIDGDIKTEKENIYNSVGALNLSWGLGGGVEWGMTSNTALVAGLYNQQGFTDVTRDGEKHTLYDDNTWDNSKATLRSITLRIGVLF